MQHPKVINHYLEEELSLQHIAGPFQKGLVPEAHVKWFRVIPKKQQPEK